MYDGVPVPRGSKGRYVVKVDNMFLDAENIDVFAKYANHSCQPNCILQKVSKDLNKKKFSPFGTEEYKTELWVKSLRPMKANEELMHNYGDSHLFEGECLCGACAQY